MTKFKEKWYCMRKSQVYEDSVTTVRCAVGITEGFKVEVEQHQGEALSPFLFAMVMKSDRSLHGI